MKYYFFNHYLLYQFARLYFYEKEMTKEEMEKFIRENTDYKAFENYDEMKSYANKHIDLYIDGYKRLTERYESLKQKLENP